MSANDIAFILGTPVHPSGTPDTVYAALDKMNQVINAYQTTIVTANAQSNGSVTVGNVAVNGTVFAFSLVANSIGGGSKMSSPGVLAIATNTQQGNVTTTLNDMTLGNSSVNTFVNSTVVSTKSAVFSSNIYVGNSTVNVSINSTAIQIGGASILTSAQRAAAWVNSSTTFVESKFNFISGNGMTVTITDDAADGLVNVAVAFTGNASATQPGGANIQVQFNDSGVLNATAGFTFNKSTNVVSVSNALSVGLNLTVGSNVLVSTSGLSVGNTSVNSTVTSSLLQVANSTGTMNVNPFGYTAGIITANGTSITVGANAIFNSSTLFYGNSSVNATMNSSAFALNGVAIAIPSIATVSQIWLNTANLVLTTDKTRSALDYQTLTDAPTVTFDANNGINFQLLATSGIGNSRTLGNLKNGTNGMSGMLKYKQDTTGGRNLLFGNCYIFNNGSAPSINTSSNSTTLYTWTVLLANSTVCNVLITAAATGINLT